MSTGSPQNVIDEQMRRHPLVSIIMPVFNSEGFVADAIRSVLAQDYPHWELLIVDDGSTDKSRSIISTFQDARLTLISQRNLGVSSARNAGLRVMKGEFFCFLDADDIFTPHSISSRLKCFRSAEIFFVDGAVDIYDSSMGARTRSWRPVSVDDHFASLVRLDGKCFFGPTWMIRNAPHIDFRLDEDLTHGEELLFYMTYAHLGKYTFTPDVILYYRRSDHSAMKNLRGLAKGYHLVASKMRSVALKPSFYDQMMFHVRSRKVMFLSFLREGQWREAMTFLLIGSI